MAVEKRTTPHSIEKALRERPFDYDFFQTVRLLECMRPDLPRYRCRLPLVGQAASG